MSIWLAAVEKNPPWAALLVLFLMMMVGLIAARSALRGHQQSQCRSRVRGQLTGAAQGKPLNIPQLRKDIEGMGKVFQTDRELFGNVYMVLVGRYVDGGSLSQEAADELATLRSALGLEWSDVEGSHAAAVARIAMRIAADGHISEAEETNLAEARRLLDLDHKSLSGESQRALDAAESILGKMRSAQAFEANGELQAVEADINLKKGEVCHLAAGGAELVDKVTERRQISGQQVVERDLVEKGRGGVYITNQRLLFVSEGSTSIKLDDILRVMCTSLERSAALTIVKDGRQAPFYFGVDDPWMAMAVLRKAMRARHAS